MSKKNEMHDIAGVLNSLRSMPNASGSNAVTESNGADGTPSETHRKNGNMQSTSVAPTDEKRGREGGGRSRRRIMRSSSPGRITAESPVRSRGSSIKRRVSKGGE